MDPEELFRGLSHERGLRTDVAKTIVMRLTDLARRQDTRHWLESAAYFGTIMFESKWSRGAQASVRGSGPIKHLVQLPGTPHPGLSTTQIISRQID